MAPTIMSKPAATPFCAFTHDDETEVAMPPVKQSPLQSCQGALVLLRRKSPNIAGNLRDQTGHLADYRRNWGNLFSVLYCR
jgi:hypothetical protein